MPGVLTELTELATALGVLAYDLRDGIVSRPTVLRHVNAVTWDRLARTFDAGDHRIQFETAFENGMAFRTAEDGLRGREPKLVEWKGPHNPPGDDVIPADLRIDHVYQVSCKYRSRIMQNAGPVRLFDHCLATERRTGSDWFHEVAPQEYQTFYDVARVMAGTDLPGSVDQLDSTARQKLRVALRSRRLPEEMHEPWRELSAAVAERSAERWRAQLTTPGAKVRMLWRLLRIGDAPYFVLGADGTRHLRLRVASAWDWMQSFELRSLTVEARSAGQPEVAWRALTCDRLTHAEREVEGHVEIRWSHGRFSGSPEAKIYLGTALGDTPGYFQLI